MSTECTVHFSLLGDVPLEPTADINDAGSEDHQEL